MNIQRISSERIKQFPQEYLQMMRGKLSKRQTEILEGSPLKSHEGMMFGAMYAHWKEMIDE
tara:strand:+ start:65 stop:247 length:183 start_codon:yes stop_codon:yes gene_type:complete